MGSQRNVRASACLGRELLVYVRDEAPTEQKILKWLGPEQAGRFHALRKAGLLHVRDDGTIILSPDHLSAAGTRFTYGPYIYHLDDDIVEIVRCAPG